MTDQQQTEKMIPVSIINKGIKWTKAHLIIIALALFSGVVIAIWTTRKMATPSTPTTPTTQSLTIIEKNPKGENFEALNSTTPLFITFNQPVNPKTAVILSIPDAELIVKTNPDNPNQLVLQPVVPWQKSQYKITIKRGLQSIDQKFATAADVEITINVKEIPRPNYDSPV